MALTRNTEFGKITIQDKVFEDYIAGLCQKPSMYDRVWLAQRPGVKAIFSDEGGIEIYVSVYVKFGGSIKETCTELAELIREGIESRTTDILRKVVVTVSGVRTSNLVRRNMIIEIVFDDNGNVISVVISE